MYHEEMLKQSPRQQLINDYARQLMRRYPQLKQEIASRLAHVNEQWAEVMSGLVLPPGVSSCQDTTTMLSGRFVYRLISHDRNNVIAEINFSRIVPLTVGLACE